MMRALWKCPVEEDKAKDIVNALLGQEINCVRKEGMVDCKTEKEFDKKFDDLKTGFPVTFIKWLFTKKNKLRNVVNIMKKTMISHVRIAAGLGNPPNKFVNNRCEAMNLVLKEATANESSDFVRFLEIVKEKVSIFIA